MYYAPVLPIHRNGKREACPLDGPAFFHRLPLLRPLYISFRAAGMSYCWPDIGPSISKTDIPCRNGIPRTHSCESCAPHIAVSGAVGIIRLR